jgi:hypothetical protein
MARHQHKPTSEAASELSGVPAVTDSAAAGDVVVNIGALGAGIAASPEPGEEMSDLAAGEEQPFGRFRRRLERFTGISDGEIVPGSIDDESELRLQLMLLREENARLKAARHQPPSAGSAIERVRLLSSPAPGAEMLDEVWAVLADCLVIREGLEQVCAEIQQAMSTVQVRLAGLSVRMENPIDNGRPEANGARHATA